jgi:Reverse transcriptase (RNA-dependent DNA polymerase)
MINAFFKHELDISKFNLTTIIFIPKNNDMTTIKHFRPISLNNYSCKIISKILTNRISSVIDKLIDQSQTTFIKERGIFDNIISAQEIFHQVKQNKTKDILLKLD